MVFLRTGTRFLFFRSECPDQTCQDFQEIMGYEKVSLEEGYRRSGENSSLLCITTTEPVITDTDDARHIFIVEDSGSSILCDLINRQLSKGIRRIDMGPRLLFLRVPAKEESILDRLSEAYEARRVSWKEGVRLGEKDQTMLGITTQRLHQVLDDRIVHPVHLLIDQPLSQCYLQLRREVLRYITYSLEDGAWFEYRINLFDTEGLYELHYQRLNLVLTGLELGMTLGEMWTRDHAMALMSVMAYQVRLFSFTKPLEMKRLLVGLEYDDNGRRVADFDLYYRNKKVPWTSTQKETPSLRKRRNKQEEGMHLRKELMETLPEAERTRLLQLESTLPQKG